MTTAIKKKKYAMYRENIKVELLGTRTPSFGGYLTNIKFSNGTIYACPPHELTKMK